jgi:hypothetical protein
VGEHNLEEELELILMIGVTGKVFEQDIDVRSHRKRSSSRMTRLGRSYYPCIAASVHHMLVNHSCFELKIGNLVHLPTNNQPLHTFLGFAFS